MLKTKTPIQPHSISSKATPILVKREDLCCPFPGPSFSKMRGVVEHIRAQDSEVIGVLDTFHSKAGWAVAWACKKLGKLCVNFWPRYKADPPKGLPREQQRMAHEMGAVMVGIKAGRSAILFHTAKKYLKEHYTGISYMMPNALKLPESIEETAKEVGRTELPTDGSMVVSISSGTIAAGVILGMYRAGILDFYDVFLHMGYSRSSDAVRIYLTKATGIDFERHGRNSIPIRIVDEGYNYADAVEDCGAPFPINPHYDAKAWKWLTGEAEKNPVDSAVTFGAPVVFWNIGD